MAAVEAISAVALVAFRLHSTDEFAILEPILHVLSKKDGSGFTGGGGNNIEGRYLQPR